MDLLTLCISPFIVGVILLLLEYFVIQPVQNTRDLAVLKSSPQIGPGWSDAIMSGIRHFRSLQSNSAFPLNAERVRVEDVKISGDRALVSATVSPRHSLALLFAMIYYVLRVRGWTVHMASRYQLTIKKDGDVIEVKKLDETTMHDSGSQGGKVTAPPRDEMRVKQVHEPVTQVTSSGVEVTINFDVENWGRRRKVHPKVHYRVSQWINGRFEERDVYSPDDWVIDLEPDVIQPVAFTYQFGFGSIVVVLTDPPHKVSVRLTPINTRSDGMG